MPEKIISAAQAREVGHESKKMAESTEFYQVSEKDFRKMLERLQKEPTKSILQDHLSTFRQEKPEITQEQFDRLSQIIKGTMKYPNTSDKGIISVFLKHFSTYAQERTMGTMGRGNAWKDVK